MIPSRVSCLLRRTGTIGHKKLGLWKAALSTRSVQQTSEATQFWHRPAESDTMLLGVNESWLDETLEGGDIDKIRVSSDSKVVAIDWSGLSYSEADELYHSVWSNTEGSVELSLDSLIPPSVYMESLVEINPSVLRKPFVLDGDTWIFKIKTK